MTGYRLFVRRLVQEWFVQWNILRSIIDGWILLYFIIPAVVFIPVIYHELWQHVDRFWSPQLTLTFLLYLMLFFCSSGHIRTYLFEADQVFLLQKAHFLHQLKRYALVYSLLHKLFVTTILFAAALPILFRTFGFQENSIACLFIIFFAYQMIILFLKKYIRRPLFQKILISILIIVFNIFIVQSSPLIYGSVGGCIATFMLGLMLIQTHSTNFFTRELEIERSERAKFTGFIMNFSIDTERTTPFRNRKPILFFKKSKRLFKVRSRENGLLELMLKVFFRDASLFKSYSQLMLLTSVAIFIVPFWVKWLLFALFLFFMRFWLNVAFKKIIDHDFFYVVPFNQEIGGEVWVRFKKWIIVPSIAWITTILLIQLLLKLII
ncbi:ABC transporter permease [Sporolactobacillus terrae]|uniref:ABC transporter permease n=1 Tax=Sporolactobacillus terrae TaxID=269673 RepID=UPI000490FEDD|nr:ABC transporter permease [Sporolactobacillus terrae]